MVIGPIDHRSKIDRISGLSSNQTLTYSRSCNLILIYDKQNALKIKTNAIAVDIFDAFRPSQHFAVLSERFPVFQSTVHSHALVLNCTTAGQASNSILMRHRYETFTV